jgi:hypothetical protein
MTQYLLSVHDDSSDAPEMTMEEMQPIFEAVEVFNQELRDSGVWVFAGGLQPPTTATVVRAHEGDDVVTTDGPFAETKEQLGGFWIVEVPDLDAALDLAAKGSAACRGAVEVRPFQEEPPVS